MSTSRGSGSGDGGVRASIFLARSLDGFLATVEGGVDWLLPYQGAGDDAGFGAFMSDVDALLMGRNTWEVVRGFAPWPYGDLPVWVRSRRPLVGAAHGEVRVEGSVSAILAALGRQGARHVYVDGGETARDALREGVVERVTLTTVPVVLGAGIPLFSPGDGAGVGGWRLLGTRACEGGLVQATYAPPPPRAPTAAAGQGTKL